MIPSADQQAELLQRLGTEVLPVEEPAVMEVRRARVTSHIAGAMRREVEKKASRRRAVRAGFAVLAAAAVLLLVVGLAWRSRTGEPRRTDRVAALSGPVVVVHAGVPKGVGQFSEVVDADEIRTEVGGHARLELAMGAVVLVSPETQVRLTSASDTSTVVDLREGRVDVEVPKLGAAREFKVTTPHADVVVHGTRFVVEVAAARGGIAPTSVRVIDGRVGVWTDGHEVMLEQGARWSNMPQSAEAPVPTAAVVEPPIAAPSAEAPRTATATPAPARSSRSAPEVAPSTLSEENRLFRQALEARRRGNLEEAIRHLDTLLARYPQSTLAQEASVERIRCLKQLGRDQVAAQEARKYLAEHPHGFAREEARDMALPPAPSSSR